MQIMDLHWNNLDTIKIKTLKNENLNVKENYNDSECDLKHSLFP